MVIFGRASAAARSAAVRALAAWRGMCSLTGQPLAPAGGDPEVGAAVDGRSTSSSADVFGLAQQPGAAVGAGAGGDQPGLGQQGGHPPDHHRIGRHRGRQLRARRGVGRRDRRPCGPDRPGHGRRREIFGCRTWRVTEEIGASTRPFTNRRNLAVAARLKRPKKGRIALAALWMGTATQRRARRNSMAGASPQGERPSAASSPRPVQQHRARHPHPRRRASTAARQAGKFWALTLGVIGVVFGDIGTSPLYAMREALAPRARRRRRRAGRAGRRLAGLLGADPRSSRSSTSSS